MVNLIITLLQRKKTFQLPLVTLVNFDIRSYKETYTGYVLNLCVKNETDWTNGLDGVSEHTDRGPYATNYIDCTYTNM